MKINSIEWHEENLKNNKIALENEREDIKRKQQNLWIYEHRCMFYEFQINSAKRDKKETFDREKYKIKEFKSKDGKND